MRGLMKIAIFQPPYPREGNTVAAEDCLRWMRVRLDGLNPGENDLVLLPEYANAPGLGSRRVVRQFAESQGAVFLQEVAASAKRLRSLVVLAGVVQSEARFFNRSMVFDATGKLVFTYDKIHLTDVETNELGLTSGSTLTVFQHGRIRFGFATCFDLYFPEHFEVLAAQHADIVLCPSYQRSESVERINFIAQVRALDSGTYLVRSSYSTGDPRVGGHSLVASPAGELLVDAGNDEGVVVAELDPQRKFIKPASHGQQAVDHRTLIESHRRPAVYRERAERAQSVAVSPFPRLCAHRGLSQACPENTLPAFAAAIASGAHEIEFDLRTSRDGIPVVCHDESVDRTTNGRGKVADLSWEDIRRLDAGIRFGEVWRGVRMPRFEEVLELTDGLVGLNIHISGVGPDGSTIKRVCDLVHQHALTDIAYVALGSETSLQIACKYAPHVSRACLAAQEDSSESIVIAERYACQRIQFGRQVTKEQIRQAHETGLICNLFWSDAPEDGMRYVRNGIDVILTNCAHTMIAGGFNALQRVPVSQKDMD